MSSSLPASNMYCTYGGVDVAMHHNHGCRLNMWFVKSLFFIAVPNALNPSATKGWVQPELSKLEEVVVTYLHNTECCTTPLKINPPYKSTYTNRTKCSSNTLQSHGETNYFHFPNTKNTSHNENVKVQKGTVTVGFYALCPFNLNPYLWIWTVWKLVALEPCFIVLFWICMLFT